MNTEYTRVLNTKTNDIYICENTDVNSSKQIVASDFIKCIS